MSCTTNQDCSGHGVCNVTCKCFKNYKGDKCDECKSNDYQMNQDGYCLQKCDSTCDIYGFDCIYDYNFKMNLCNCEITNSNPDENCKICIDGYHGTSRDHCQPIECVQNRELCGGEGSCEKVDGTFVCVCQGNFIGTFCENCKNNMIKTYDDQCLPQECVNDRVDECSGYGKCDVEKLECVCNHGYRSNLCQKCAIGFKGVTDYYGTKCYHEICFFEDEEYPCSENGICVTQGTESFCECEKNTSGEQCQDCGEEYEKLLSGYCLPKVCAVNGLDCADNGYCVFRNNTYQCSCPENYDVATKCSSCVPGYSDIDGWCISNSCMHNNTECSEHGYCLHADYVNEIYECVCESAYKGEFCLECDIGFIKVENGFCTKSECIINNTECSTNGYCQENYSTGWGCRCDNSYGNFCEICDKDFLKAANGHCVIEDCFSAGQECGGHGICSRINFEHLCVCEENFSEESRCSECKNGLVLKGNKCGQWSEKQLSGGAIAGICVGVLVVLGVIGVGVGVGLRVKKNRQGKVIAMQGGGDDNLI